MKKSKAKIDIEINSSIHVQRAIKRISQEELAIAVGVSRQTISQLEKNKYNPSLKLAVAIADYFDVSIYDIFKFKVSKESGD